MQYLKAQKSNFLASSVLATGAVVIGVSPTYAQTTTTGGVADVNATVTSLGGVAAAITTIVLGAMGVRMAIKLVNRVATKG